MGLIETSLGKIVVLDQDDLVECAVLAQHMIGTVIEKKWSVDEALSLIRNTHSVNLKG